MFAKRQTSIILVTAFVALLSTFWLYPAFAFIFFISLLLQLLLVGPVNLLSKKIPRGLSAGIILFVFLLIIFAFATVVSVSFIPTFSSFIMDLPAVAAKIQNMQLIQDMPTINSSLDDIWGELTSMGSKLLRESLQIILSTFNKIIDFVIIVFVTFYLLKDGRGILHFVSNLFPRKDKVRVFRLFTAVLHSLQIYIRSQLLMCCITGIVVYGYFTLMDVKYASVFAVLSGVCEFVPVLGPTVASIFGIMLTATDAPYLILQTTCFYLIMTQINHNIVYPNIVGKSLDIHPVTTILGVVLGGEILGTAGMFLAVPCIVVVKHLILDVYKNEKRLKKPLNNPSVTS
ncbi:AI-2E family transporter [Anaerovibrio sp.]|uniref:AI-2E family transporter n=1 Tax=Anaerovibrio sp. TaxID=1872532 RepID=UPI0025C19538|nr:AI-2E family transporter [Anaerovibrio sp.]MBR2143219.1 AI-2E family transporter [Anaerovibrio sp.]